MQLTRISNNQVSSEANKFFLDMFVKKGYATAGKTVKIDAESQSIIKDLAAAGLWYMLTGSAVAPTAALLSPLYVGDVRIRTFVQAFTSGTFDKYQGIAQVNNGGASQLWITAGKKAIGAVEQGDPTDANFIETYLTDQLFNDVVMQYGVGGVPVGTIRTIIDFEGFKISLV